MTSSNSPATPPQQPDPDKRRALLLSVLLHSLLLLVMVLLWRTPEAVPLESYLVIDVGTPALAEETSLAPAADAPAPQAQEPLVASEQAGEPIATTAPSPEPAVTETPAPAAEPVEEAREAVSEPVAASIPEPVAAPAQPETTQPASLPEPQAEAAPEPAPAPVVEPTPAPEPTVEAAPAPTTEVAPLESTVLEADISSTSLPEIEEPITSLPDARSLPVPQPEVEASVSPARTITPTPTVDITAPRDVPTPEVSVDVAVPETAPIPLPAIEASVVESEAAPLPIPLPETSAEVEQTQPVPTPQVEASIAAAQRIPQPQAEASVAQASAIPTPQVEASVTRAQAIPNPEVQANVSDSQTIPQPQVQATVAAAQAIPQPQVQASVAAARPVPQPQASASVNTAASAAATAGQGTDNSAEPLAATADANEGNTTTAGQPLNREAGGNSDRSGQTTAQEGASADNLGLAASPDGSETPTGVPISKVPYSENLERPLTVMIDNVGGYPQNGLLEASLIIEMPVEGGQSRLMTVYNRVDPATVGPIRSARKYFFELSESMNGVYVHVGGSPDALTAIAQSDTPTFDAFSTGDLFRREGPRSAPYNMFSSGLDLRREINAQALASSRATSGTRYQPEATETAVSRVDVDFSGAYDTGFAYNQNLNQYRWIRNGDNAVDADGQAVYVDAVVIAEVAVTQIPGDTEGRLYIPTREGGLATLYLRGKAIAGRWDRDGGVRFTTSLGEPIRLEQFQKTWVVFVPAGRPIVEQ